MWAYLSHYLWIIISVELFVRPNRLDLAYAAPITLAGCEVMILISHFMLACLYKIYMPNTKKKT